MYIYIYVCVLILNIHMEHMYVYEWSRAGALLQSWKLDEIGYFPQI